MIIDFSEVPSFVAINSIDLAEHFHDVGVEPDPCRHDWDENGTCSECGEHEFENYPDDNEEY